MATLGQRYDSIMLQIQKTEMSQEYNTSSGEKLRRGELSTLYKERDNLLDKISAYGRNYEEGMNTTPMGDTSLVSFS